MTREAFGEKVRQYRLRQGWDQQELAKRIQKSVPTVSRVEGGTQNLKLVDILVIADVLGVPVVVLFGGVPDVTEGLTAVLIAAQCQQVKTKAKELLQEADKLDALVGVPPDNSPTSLPSSGLHYFKPLDVFPDLRLAACA